MIFILARIIFVVLVGFILYRVFMPMIENAFSDTKECPRCEGKGWWQNTRNRDKCEWCKGSGRIPKDMPV